MVMIVSISTYRYYLYRKTYLTGIHNFVHLNLAISLLLALAVFIGGIERAKENKVNK